MMDSLVKADNWEFNLSHRVDEQLFNGRKNVSCYKMRRLSKIQIN